MKSRAVLSVVGGDRVGVADDLSVALSARKIDIEDSRMTSLQGQFAIIVQLRGEDRDITRLQQDLAKLREQLGFHLHMEKIPAPRPSKISPRFSIECYSSGPSGMNGVTAILRNHRINIEDLKTESATAPWTSEITFHMTACITIPESCSIPTLRRELRDLERERDLDIVIKPNPPRASVNEPELAQAPRP